MSELTNTSKTSIIVIVVILTGLMIGFHSENMVQGFFPEYSNIDSLISNQCDPVRK